MKSFLRLTVGLGAFAVLLMFGALSLVPVRGSGMDMQAQQYRLLARLRPIAPPEFQREYSAAINAPLTVAKVFGRSPACADIDADFIYYVARQARYAGMDPAVAAATIATESGCNPLAVSNRGAVGIMQVMPKVWNTQFDFSRVNLLNREQGVAVGLQIESGLIRQWGLRGGVRRYQGLGEGCDSCDDGYTVKILALAGRR